jgi:predicted  nucleic acid-binding Zn-ribbon protein
MGMDVYRARADLRNMDQRRRTLEDRLADAKSDEERRRWREELRDLDYGQRRARDRVRDAEWALDRLR